MINLHLSFSKLYLSIYWWPWQSSIKWMG